MSIALPSVGTPAHPYATNWAPSYREKLAWKLKKFIGSVAEVTFGCRHRHITLPFNDHQTCLDCGATRLHLYNTEMYMGGVTDAPIFIGLWKKPVAVQSAHRVVAKKLIANALAPRRTDTIDRSVYARTNGIMDRFYAENDCPVCGALLDSIGECSGDHSLAVRG